MATACGAVFLLANGGVLAAPPIPAAELPASVVTQLGEHRFVHHGRFKNLFFLPAGDAVLAVTEDEACVWDLRTGSQRLVFNSQSDTPDSITCGALSRDGQTLLLAENGARLHVFDVATGRRKGVLQWAEQGASVVALSSDGRFVASDDGHDVILWDGSAAKEIRRFSFKGNYIRALRFSPDDRHLAIATSAAQKEMWIQDITGREAPTKLEGDVGWTAWFDYSPDGKTLAGASEQPVDKSSHWELVNAWSADTGRSVMSAKGSSYQGVFSPDGRWLATCTLSEVKILDARTGEKVKQLFVGHGQVWAVAFSPDGKTLATGLDRRILFWNTETWQEMNPGRGHAEPVQTLAFAPDGRTIASGASDGSLILWSWPEGKEIQRVDKLGSYWGVQWVAFSPDGRRIVTTGWVNGGDNFHIHDVAAGAPVADFGKAHPGHGATFSTDGKQVLTGQFDGAIGVWDAASGEWLRQVGSAKGTIHALQPVPGGNQVWWAGDYQGLGLRNLRTGEDERMLSGGSHHGGAVLTVSPDESWLAVDSTAWDLKTGEVILHEQGSQTGAAISPDGRLLAFASGASGEDVVFWEALTRRVIHRARLGIGNIPALAFSPDGTVLAVAANADVRIWDVTGQLQERRLPKLDLAPADMESLWETLGDDEGMAAHRAAWRLSAGGEKGVQFLDGKLRPAISPTPEQVEVLRARFHDPDYDVRDHAARELLDMGIALRDEDREALRRPERVVGAAFGVPAPVSLQPPPVLLPLPERVRASRAVMALEHGIAPSAESLLERLSQGAPEAPLTREARSALDRVRVRQRHKE